MNDKGSGRVQEYFHRTSAKWDAIYSAESGAVMNWLNERFRKGVYNRARRVVEIVTAERQHLNTVLDVGCGSGRIALQFAEMGLRVTGIDLAPNMIEIAKNIARKNGLDNRSLFLHGNFIEFPFHDHAFDAAIAMGVLDYIANAEEFLAKMKRCISRMIIVTFPAKGTPRSHVRKIRLALKNCPVHYYDRENLDQIYKVMGFSEYTIEKVNNQYLVAARIGH